MLVFGLFGAKRMTLEIKPGMKVKDLRHVIHQALGIPEDENKHDKKGLVLSWAGSDLSDPWVLSDLSIVPGTTIHINLKEEVKPVLYIHCSHSKNTIKVCDRMTVAQMTLEEVRSLVSRETGLPVGIYRLTTRAGQEMFDGHTLDAYRVDVGHTIFMETLDGWQKFLNLAIIGFTQQVLDEIIPDETIGRYQVKVALFIAAHFGHVDLARAALRQGIRASEPVGYPPQRMWCADMGHVESRKAAVHEAVEMGQMGVLRLLVTQDVTVVTAKDGNGLAPLNIALRKKMKNCASFLLAKQWSKVLIDADTGFALHVHTYTHLRQWCDRAKERVFMNYGQAKSSLKRRPFLSGPLVGFGVNVDGFSPSVMTGKTRGPHREKKKVVARQSNLQVGVPADPESYFRQIIAVQNLKSMSDRVTGGKWGKVVRVASQAKLAVDDATTSKLDTGDTGFKPQRPSDTRGPSDADATDKRASLRLPPVTRQRWNRPAPRGHTRLANHAEFKDELRTPGPEPSAGDPRRPALERERNMLSKLTRSQGKAYFMVRRGSKATLLQLQSQGHGRRHGEGGKPGSGEARAQRKVLPAVLTSGEASSQKLAGDRSAMHSQLAGSLDAASTVTGAESPTPQPPAETSHRDTANDSMPPARVRRAPADVKTPGTSDPPADVKAPGTSNSLADAEPTSKKRRKKRKQSRVTSALLLSKAAGTGEGIALPLISDEHDRRPFFYFNGKRERTFVEPVVTLWSNYMRGAGSTPRERAIKALSVANSFKDKPWLGQLRIALQLTSMPLKRNVSFLRESRRAFAV